MDNTVVNAVNAVGNTVDSETVNNAATWLGEALGKAWVFITNTSNLQLLIGIILIVVIVQLVMKGTGKVLETMLFCLIVLFAFHFASIRLGINIDIIGIIGQFIEFVKTLLSGAGSGAAA